MSYVLRGRIKKLEADAAEWENVVNDGRFAEASPEVLARAICECAHRVMLAALPLAEGGASREEAKAAPEVKAANVAYDAAYAEVLKRLKEHAEMKNTEKAFVAGDGGPERADSRSSAAWTVRAIREALKQVRVDAREEDLGTAVEAVRAALARYDAGGCTVVRKDEVPF